MSNFVQKCWGGVSAYVIGKCKYCKEFSLADVMKFDKDKKPYHQQCKDIADREEADNTQNLSQES